MKNNSITYLLYLVASLLIISCGGESMLGTTQKTSQGYNYVFHKDEAGAIPEKTEFIYFQMDITDQDGKTLQTYRGQEMTPSMQIPEDMSTTGDNPLIEILASCSVGDSVIMTVPIDSMPNPAAYAGITEMRYHLVALDILSQADNEARVTEERAAIRAAQEVAGQAIRSRLPEVSEKAEDLLVKYNDNAFGDDLKVSPDGVKYVIHEEGTGDIIGQGRGVVVQYYGKLLDGTDFDNSFKRGQGYKFTTGPAAQVIAGWNKTIQLFKKGTKATLFIPPAMGYGATGSPPAIPPNAELMFYIEVENVL